MYSLFVFFLLFWGGSSYGGLCYVLSLYVYRAYYVFSMHAWVARASGASAPWVLSVTPNNSLLYVAIIILYSCMFVCDK